MVGSIFLAPRFLHGVAGPPDTCLNFTQTMISKVPEWQTLVPNTEAARGKISNRIPSNQRFRSQAPT